MSVNEDLHNDDRDERDDEFAGEDAAAEAG